MKKRTLNKILLLGLLIMTCIAYFLPCYNVLAATRWIDDSGLQVKNGFSTPAFNKMGDTASEEDFDLFDDDAIPYAYNKIEKKDDGSYKVKKSGEKISWLNTTTARILASPGFSLEKNMGEAGVGIGSIIYGKISKDSDGLSSKFGGNLFHFSLDDDNMYGQVGAVVYVALRSIICILVAVKVMASLAKSSVTVTGQDKSIMKETLYTGFIVISMLFLMPNIVDLIVYMKNVLLVAVTEALPGDASLNLSQNFWEAFLCAPTIFYGFMYSISVFFMLYLMVLYIGNALALTCLFAIFPFVALLSMADKGTFTSWLKQFVGIVMTPLLDGIMLLVPATILKKIGEGSTGSIMGALIALVTCFFIVPARQAVKEALGLGGGGWGEAAGLGAFRFGKSLVGTAAKLAVAAATGSAIGLAGLASDNSKNNEESRNAEKDAADNAALHEDLSRTGTGIKDTDMDSKTSSFQPKNDPKDKVDNEKLKGFEQQGEEGTGPSGTQTGGIDTDTGSQAGVLSEGTGSHVDLEDGRVTAPMSEGGTETGEFVASGETGGTSQGGTGAVAEDGQTVIAEQGQETPETIDSVAHAQATYGYSDEDRMNNLVDIGDRQTQIDADYARLDDLNNERQGIINSETAAENAHNQAYTDLALAEKQMDKALAADPNAEKQETKDAIKRYDEAENQVAAANKDYAAFQAGAQQRKDQKDALKDQMNEVSAHVATLNGIQNQARQREAYFADMDKLRGGTGEKYQTAQEMAIKQQQNAILRAHANHKNFDSKQMAGVLSNEDKARFYRERAKNIRDERVKANHLAIAKGAGIVANEFGRAGVQMGATLATSGSQLMMGADEAMRDTQSVARVSGEAWTAGTTMAVAGGTAIADAAREVSHMRDANVRDSRQLGNREAVATSARQYANKVQAQRPSSGGQPATVTPIQSIVSTTSPGSVTTINNPTNNIHQIQDGARASDISHNDSTKDYKDMERDAQLRVEKAEKEVIRERAAMEQRREKEGAGYNPTLNVTAPKESRPVKAYDPTAYRSIVQESRERSSSSTVVEERDVLQAEERAVNLARYRQSQGGDNSDKPQGWTDSGQSPEPSDIRVMDEEEFAGDDDDNA